MRGTGPTKCQSKTHTSEPPAAEGTFDLSWTVLDADADPVRTAQAVKRLCQPCRDAFHVNGGTTHYHRFP